MSLNRLAMALVEVLEAKVHARHSPEGTDPESARILSRAAEWRLGWKHYEAEQRRDEESRALGLAKSKAAVTPGACGKECDARAFRVLAAKLGSAAQETPVAQFAASEARREISAPTVGSPREPKRFARRQQGTPRMRLRYERRKEQGVATAVAGQGNAGGEKSVRSARRAALKLGRPCVLPRSATQEVAALITGGADLRGAAEGSGAPTGSAGMMRDLRVGANGVLRADL